MKVILSHGYFLKDDKTEQSIMMPYPPQGILHIGTYLNTKGIACKIYDSTFKSFNELTLFLKQNKPQYLGLYANLMTRPNILKLIRFVHESESLQNTIIIVGGPDIKHHASLYVEYGAHFCITGEGEKTLWQLLVLLDKKDFEGVYNIKGITCKSKNKEIISTGEANLIESIDDLPFPDFEMIKIQDYFSTWKNHHGFSSITLSTMRGCPYSCRWCSKAVFGRSFRRRSAFFVVNEIKRLHKQYSPDRFWIVDDVFTISEKWLAEFNQAMQDSNLSVKYECITRADKLSKESIGLLKASGCFRLWIGAESGSQKILDLMNRGVKAEKVREMIKLTKNAGIETGTFLMLGYPGEVEKDIIETVRHLKLTAPDHFTVTLSYPIPGTEFYNEVKDKDLKIPGPWGSYSDRDLDFKRTYKTRYYKYANRYIQHAVRSYQLRIKNRIIGSVKHKLVALLSRGGMLISRL